MVENHDGSAAHQDGQTHQSASASDGQAAQGKRERSAIQFPYIDLENAVVVARGIHEVAGPQCELHQLAPHLGHDTVDSGMFRAKISAARMFGLIETDKQTARLTSLGRDIIDSTKEKRAKVDAFLAVPLYREIWDRYKGQLLPRDIALERDIVNLGVSQKQSDRARQTFQRSAQQAGFFAYGRERLVMPSLVPTAPQTPPNAASVAPDDGGTTGIQETQRIKSTPTSDETSRSLPPELLNVHPAIRGLLFTLPPAGARWPNQQQEDWLTAVRSIFGLIYRDVDN